MRPHTIAFAIDQRQDFFLSLAYVHMLGQRREERPFETVALLLPGMVFEEFRPYLGAFDRVEVLSGYHPPNRLRAVPGVLRLALRYRRQVRALNLRRTDAVVGYSFRAIVLNAIARSATEKPFLVRIRRCDNDQERLLTRRRPVASAYWNLWNWAFGYSRLRYRWLPSSNRHGAGTYLRDPFDAEFCLSMTPPTDPSAKSLPWPFPVLRQAYGSSAGEDVRRTVVVLGERYPLVEGDDLDRFRALFDDVLRFVRESHPQHRLVFKPRSELSEIGQDLEGYERGRSDVVLESLLLEDATIEKVLSFKSSGSVVATLYGAAGYLLYPLCGFPADFRAHLDQYFDDARESVVTVSRLEDVAGEAPRTVLPGPGEIVRRSAPLLDALVTARA